MPNIYTQIHLQLVFAVKYRAAVISPTWKYELYNYMTGIIQHYNHKLIAINGMPDHIHILIGMRPTQSLSDLMQQLKQSSSKWINEKRMTRSQFAWQEGYGAFSYGKSQLPALIQYIDNQEQHHQTRTFLDEYRRFLDIFGIDYDEQFLFKPLD
ncbi:IS200/IS605 family transposase [Fibrella aquatilis]|uniref:IS200/IS605 family transposase n=1 Tax=Fibrella aquatilis TaxID=2817059 RepID=A0A939G2S6_9BACT|nr:IS200/IS605 family transposase [Fibrella aquatilis]MBO0930133.1 IS200/IS605 family transposase [Fibrella aquatilis]